MKTINLDEIATADIDQNGAPRPGMETYDHVCRVAKEAVKQALEIAAEEATVSLPSHLHLDGTKNVSKQSILNVIERVK